MSLPKTAFRRSLKLASLGGKLWKEEVGRLLGSQPLTTSRVKQAKLLVEELGQLKGAAMKAGQLFALEARDFFPEEVVAILDKLQNQAKFLGIQEVRLIIAEELGEKRHAISEISETPIAAASIGQVHRARFRGSDVALKVQYPGIGDTVDADLKVLNRIVKLVSPLLGKSQTDYHDLFDEIKDVFRAETSYLNEAELTRRYGELAKAIPGVRVPKVFDEISTDHLLALTFEPGRTLSDAVLDPAFTPALRKQFAQRFLEVFVAEFCEWGLVQTDPNLGNFLIDLPNEELVLLDFGSTRTYTQAFRRDYGRLVLATLAGESEACLEEAIELGLVDHREKEPARRAFLDLINASMAPFRRDQFNFGESDYPQQMRSLAGKMVRELEFTPPPRSLIFLHRKLGGIFQILRRLDVSLDLRPYLEKYREMAKATS